MLKIEEKYVYMIKLAALWIAAGSYLIEFICFRQIYLFQGKAEDFYLEN